MKDFVEDDFNDSSMDDNEEAFADVDSVDCFSPESSDIGHDELVSQYKDLDTQYHAAKDSIDFSFSDEERDFWEKRAEQLWQERDEADFRLTDFKSK